MIQHLKEINMSYSAHLKHALGLFWRLKQAELALFIHAFIPFLFEHTASDIVRELNRDFEELRLRLHNDEW